MKVAFIGLGIMGSRMASHLITPEVELVLYNRSAEKALPLKEKGATIANDISTSLEGADIIFTMLANPQAVDEVSYEIIRLAPKEALWVDCSTVGPEDVLKFSRKAANADLAYLEAPVAGTKQPAEKGELVFFVGGKSSDLKRVDGLLALMGKKTIHMGDHGQAAAIKLLVNLLLAQSMLAYSEAIKLGTAMGLGLEKMQDILLGTPVTPPFLQALRPKLDAVDKSVNFPLPLMHKDLRLVQQASANSGIHLSLASVAEAVFQNAKGGEFGNEDFSSIFHFIQGN